MMNILDAAVSVKPHAAAPACTIRTVDDSLVSEDDNDDDDDDSSSQSDIAHSLSFSDCPTNKVLHPKPSI